MAIGLQVALSWPAVKGFVTATGQAGEPLTPVALLLSLLSSKERRSTGQAGGIQGLELYRYSKERNDPPGKPVAFKPCRPPTCRASQWTKRT